MASRQRQLVFLTRAARRYNGPDGSASTRLGPILIGGKQLLGVASSYVSKRVF